METNNSLIIPHDDLTLMLQQTESESNLMIAGMLSIIDENKKLNEGLQCQDWCRRMFNTIIGKNKATATEIRRNHDKLNAYVAQAIEELYNRNKISNQIMISLGLQITQLYNSHLELKSILCSLTSKLNEKIESVDNYHTLLQEIDEGIYGNQPSITDLLYVISQIDFRMVSDPKKMRLLEVKLSKQNLLNSEHTISVKEYLNKITTLQDDSLGVVYCDMRLFQNKYIMIDLAIEAIESWNLISEPNRKLLKKDVIVDRIISDAGVDGSVEVTLNEFYNEIISLRKDLFYESNTVSIENEQIFEENEHEENVFKIESEEIADEELDETEKTDEMISSILQIGGGEHKIFKNKNIHINAYINCEGTLEIDNCILYYNESEACDEIKLLTNAELIIKNSEVICKGFDKKPFILSEGENTNVIFENNIFIDCAYFFEANKQISFKMAHCELKNCFNSFINISADSGTNCNISHNKMIQDNLNTFYIDTFKDFGRNSIIKIKYILYRKDINVIFCENEVVEKQSFRDAADEIYMKYRIKDLSRSLPNYSNCPKSEFLKLLTKDNIPYRRIFYLESNIIEVSNCTFTGMSLGIEVPSISNSVFNDCQGCVQSPDSYDEILFSVDNCSFNNCTNVIFVGEVYQTKIQKSNFISCYDKLIYMDDISNRGNMHIESCQFTDIKNNSDINCITLGIHEIGEKPKSNYIKDCIFDGVELGNNFLVVAKRSTNLGEPKCAIGYIENCDFRNYTTKRQSGKIIKQYIQYNKIFKNDLDFYAIRLQNCRGLD